jgi:helicase
MEQWLEQELARQEIESLTEIQTMALDAGLVDGESMVVCAPTSSGKTLVGEIAILAGLRRGHEALYLVSHKALADQKFEDFSRKYGASSPFAARIGVATGDREDGAPDPQIWIVTYERALSLVVSGVVEVGSTVVIADELQILGEEKRGPEIELLCTLLRSRRPKQFVALTATIQNSDDLASWLEGKNVTSPHRDIDLIQEIWTDSAIYSLKFGQDLGDIRATRGSNSLDTLSALDSLLSSGRGPVLVFVETRRDAMELASAFAAKTAVQPAASRFAEQLDLFSEVTEFSDRLKSTAVARIAFHTADLTPSERNLVEEGLISNNFDACFATPTLAAGVNFPFKTVLFDRIRRRYITPPLLPLSSYRNMSGRAGRLRMHDTGYAILLPRDEEERRYSNTLVGPENERMFSKLASMSMRKIALALVSWNVAGSQEQLVEFLEGTLFWYQVRNRNPTRLLDLAKTLRDAIEWLIEEKMVEDGGAALQASDLGRAVARSGLLPSSAVQIVEHLRQHRDKLETDFETYELALIHLCCNLDEFDAVHGQRFLPPINPGANSSGAMDFLNASELFVPLRSSRRGANNAAVAVDLFAAGEPERRISDRTGIPSGQIHRFAGDVAWTLEGIHRIAAVPDVGITQRVANQLSILARRARMGVPPEVYDLLQIARRYRVPGLGRQRAVALLKKKYADRQAALSAGVEQLEKVLGHRQRAEKLIEALSSAVLEPQNRAREAHLKQARHLGIEDIVVMAYESDAESYVQAVGALLSLVGGAEVRIVNNSVLRIDSTPGDAEAPILVNCLVAEAPISASNAFAVTKSPLSNGAAHLVTVARPGFEIMAEKKACTSSDVTLVPNGTLVAAVIQALANPTRFTPEKFFEWFSEPGIADIEIVEAESGAPVAE